MRRGAAALVLLWIAVCATAGQPEDAGKLLSRADSIKTANHGEFVAILRSLEARSAQLSGAQQDYLRYLQAWKAVNEGLDQAIVIPQLKDLIQRVKDPTLQLRARSTLMNFQELSGQYEAAYSELNHVLERLPSVTDKGAREQALMNAAQLYRAVGQTDLALNYAQQVVEENWSGRGVCRGSQQKLAALFESGRLRSVDAEVDAATDACERLGEAAYANEIRTHVAKLYIEQGQLDQAIALLKGHYEEALRTQYFRLISQFEALLADAYRRKGYAALAQSFAFDSLGHLMKGPYVDSTVRASQVLYELAKARGDFKAALEYHEQFAAADRGHMDDVGARQLAYDKVAHETLATQLQITSLTRQNQVLRLEKALAAEAVENSRLYAAVLLTVLVFVALWTYRTRRSQLHFMNMSRLDGLTGISNRHHFISQAESALEQARKSQQPLCMLLCDLDHFKSINDRLGHAMGDFVLQETVARCRTHLREHEIFGRFGGEEFAILLPGSRPEESQQRADQLRIAISSISAGFGSGEVKVSASFGVATTSASGYELRQLLAHADAALYQAKGAGRNRVVLYDAATTVVGRIADVVVHRAAVGG